MRYLTIQQIQLFLFLYDLSSNNLEINRLVLAQNFLLGFQLRCLFEELERMPNNLDL